MTFCMAPPLQSIRNKRRSRSSSLITLAPQLSTFTPSATQRSAPSAAQHLHTLLHTVCSYHGLLVPRWWIDAQALDQDLQPIPSNQADGQGEHGAQEDRRSRADVAQDNPGH